MKLGAVSHGLVVPVFLLKFVLYALFIRACFQSIDYNSVPIFLLPTFKFFTLTIGIRAPTGPEVKSSSFVSCSSKSYGNREQLCAAFNTTLRWSLRPLEYVDGKLHEVEGVLGHH